MNSSHQKFHLAAITGGALIPSARYRIRALIPYLEQAGIELNEFCPKFSIRSPKLRIQRPAWFISALMERISFIWRARGYDAVVLQRELIPTIPTIEKLLPGPKILDVDDAIFLRRGGWAARNAAKSSIGVVCGNNFLAEHFSKWNSSVTIIPTGIDTSQMKPLPEEAKHNKKVIGWIGTSGNLKYLNTIAPAIRQVLKTVPDSELHIITDSDLNIPNDIKPLAKFIAWYPDVEFIELPRWHVGIMPLPDNDWTRGKCSFKLLQYLAAGLPVVASPVGMNANILRGNDVGFSAETSQQWSDALCFLLSNKEAGYKMGENGRQYVEEHYDLSVVSRLWRQTLDCWL